MEEEPIFSPRSTKVQGYCPTEGPAQRGLQHTGLEPSITSQAPAASHCICQREVSLADLQTGRNAGLTGGKCWETASLRPDRHLPEGVTVPRGLVFAMDTHGLQDPTVPQQLDTAAPSLSGSQQLSPTV